MVVVWTYGQPEVAAHAAADPHGLWVSADDKEDDVVIDPDPESEDENMQTQAHVPEAVEALSDRKVDAFFERTEQGKRRRLRQKQAFVASPVQVERKLGCMHATEAPPHGASQRGW